MVNCKYSIGNGVDSMVKVDAAVRKETIRIAIGTVALCALMQLVFLVLNRWDVNVLYGTILGCVASVANFFFMGMTIQKAVLLEKEAAAVKIRASLTLRMLMMVAVAIIGGVIPVFNLLAVIIPFLFPRIIIVFCQIIDKRANTSSSEPVDLSDDRDKNSNEV